MEKDIKKIAEARHHDPFSVLGRHPDSKGNVTVRVNIPFAQRVWLTEESNLSMERVSGTDIFTWYGEENQVPSHYRVRWIDDQGNEHIRHDPYSFLPQLADFDLYLFNQGKHWHTYRFMGSHLMQVEGITGFLFVVWAPNAGRVSVIGDFNRWDGRAHQMRVRGDSGVWELFIPDLSPESLYKYEIFNSKSGDIFIKSDPYGQYFEVRPKTATITRKESSYDWNDADWLKNREKKDWYHTPMSVYEVHLGSWQKREDGSSLSYRQIAPRLVEYVKHMGFSHIQLMPITEHPYDGSWGYQTTGYFAPTSRYGDPDDFRYFVDYCHQMDIGVFLDWVPAHFPKDAHGLANFDGEAVYEHADPRKGEHLDWSTLIYNYARHEVRAFLISSANYWIEEFHLDGLRVDAVASMLYLDYSREDWIPNKYGGRENLEALEFLRELNIMIHGEHPGVLMIAEESTSWPQVTRPVYLGGLGFSMKWNMGWMNDTLEYITHDPIYRKYQHDVLTFSLLYAFTENFILPFSHDEVVHGKSSMIYKMPGDEWQRFANLRVLYTYMFSHPGKKLLFMGCEFGQGSEWQYDRALEWYVLDYSFHQGLQKTVQDLNRLHFQSPALHYYDFKAKGFEWIDCHDGQQSTLSYLRKNGDEILAILLNFTPIPRHNYQIGVPLAGNYYEIFNSDSEIYGGSNVGNGPGPVVTLPEPWMGRPYSLKITLPPLAGIILRLEKRAEDLAAETADSE
ncbi:MAG: 1,4-alpha-glucan branching protein GlgB [Thermodesulfobacteriota bacterium]